MRALNVLFLVAASCAVPARAADFPLPRGFAQGDVQVPIAVVTGTCSTANASAYFDGTHTLACSDKVLELNSDDTLSILAGQLLMGKVALRLTGTLASGSAEENAAFVTATTNSAGEHRRALYGFTTGSATNAQPFIGLEGTVDVAGTGTDPTGTGGVPHALANMGVAGNAIATTTGYNLGGRFQSYGGQVNIGALGYAITDKTNAFNVGMMALGHQTSTAGTTTEIGLYAGLVDQYPTIAANTDGAIVADTTKVKPILRLRWNNADQFIVGAYGHFRFFGTTPTIAAASTCTGAAIAALSTDTSGTLTATSCTAGQHFDVTFANAYQSSAASCQLTGGNAAGATDVFYQDDAASTTATVRFTAATGSASAVVLHYFCGENR